MNSTLSFFGNDRYTILKILWDNQVTVGDGRFSPLSQQEIADIADCSKLKANRVLNELIDAGYVDSFHGKRGKYAITEKGYSVLDLMSRDCAENG